MMLNFFLLARHGNANCSSEAACCPDRNDTCRVAANGLSDECYCDQFCITNIGFVDCCEDYADYCINRGKNSE